MNTIDNIQFWYKSHRNILARILNWFDWLYYRYIPEINFDFFDIVPGKNFIRIKSKKINIDGKKCKVYYYCKNGFACAKFSKNELKDTLYKKFN